MKLAPWLRGSSIARSLFGSFLLVLVPMIAVSMMASRVSINIIQRELTASYGNSLTLLSRQLDSNLNKFRSLANALSVDTGLNALNQAPEGTGVIWGYVALLNQLQFYALTNELESDITIYLLGRGRAFSSRRGINVLMPEESAEITRASLNNMGSWRFRHLPNNGDHLVLSYIKSMQLYSSQRSVIVSVDIEESVIRKLLDGLRVQGGGFTFLVDSEGNIIFPENRRHPDMTRLRSAIRTLQLHEKGPGQLLFHEGKERFRVILNRSEHTGLILATCLPENQIMQPIIQARRWIIIIVGVSLCLALGFTFFNYQGLVAPICRLIDGMRQVREGNLHVQIPVAKMAELGFMHSQFNHMVAELSAMVKRIDMEHMKYQEAQLKFLQSQINPHFLYNCLNFIYQMAMGGNTEGAAKMSLYLGRYFRYALRSGEDLITVREEMDNLVNYMEIQKMRYPGRIIYITDLPEGVLDAYIPRLVIQPIIENAVVHGIEETSSPGTIWVKGAIQDDIVKIIVEDDCKGIPQEKLQVLREELDATERGKSEHGLVNAHLRLKLEFGEKAGIELGQRSPSGTKVIISVPLRQGRDKDV